MAIEVRTCRTVEELIEAAGAISEYGAWEIDAELAERWIRVHPLDRMHAAFEDGRAVGGAGAFPFDFSVPGGSVACAGVTVVGVYPTHRRRGVLTAMMRAQLDDAHERGDPIAALWASDERIYVRYGYGLASLAGSIELPRDYSAFAEPLEPVSRTRYVEEADAPKVLGPIWEAVRKETPGMFARSPDWWETRVARDPPERRPPGAGPKRYVVAERDGVAEGYAIYRHAPKWEAGVSSGTLIVIEALATSLAGTRGIWRYLCDIEWVETISATLLPPDHPLWFILATPRRMRMRIGDGLFVRLVDVGAALSGRSYAADGSLVIDVADSFCPWNEGRWKLEGGEASRTEQEPDLACDVTALGSVYLGGFSFAELARGGRVEELHEGAAARADALFKADRHPWCPEIF